MTEAPTPFHFGASVLCAATAKETAHYRALLALLVYRLSAVPPPESYVHNAFLHL